MTIHRLRADNQLLPAANAAADKYQATIAACMNNLTTFTRRQAKADVKLRLLCLVQ